MRLLERNICGFGGSFELSRGLRYWGGIEKKAINMPAYLYPQEHQVILVGAVTGSLTMPGKE